MMMMLCVAVARAVILQAGRQAGRQHWQTQLCCNCVLKPAVFDAVEETEGNRGGERLFSVRSVLMGESCKWGH